MVQQDKDMPEIIYRPLGKLYELNAHGCFTEWPNRPGHTNGIYTKIIKGKRIEGKKAEIVYEALICTRFHHWKDIFSVKIFDPSDFLSFVQSLIDHKITAIVKVKYKKIPK
ncbi:MAG: hypothetical protein LBT43_01945 [Prevotella sp.]|jgi:hypothetical protein|nr:hypothetical protein [Prevotella sp.]